MRNSKIILLIKNLQWFKNVNTIYTQKEQIIAILVYVRCNSFVGNVTFKGVNSMPKGVRILRSFFKGVNVQRRKLTRRF